MKPSTIDSSTLSLSVSLCIHQTRVRSYAARRFAVLRLNHHSFFSFHLTAQNDIVGCKDNNYIRMEACVRSDVPFWCLLLFYFHYS